MLCGWEKTSCPQVFSNNWLGKQQKKLWDTFDKPTSSNAAKVISRKYFRSIQSLDCSWLDSSPCLRFSYPLLFSPWTHFLTSRYLYLCIYSFCIVIARCDNWGIFILDDLPQGLSIKDGHFFPQPEGDGMGETYQPFVVIEAVYMGWFTLEFFVRFLSSPSKVFWWVNTFFYSAKFLSDWVCTEVDEYSRPSGNPALLHISCVLQVKNHVLWCIIEIILHF